VYGLVNRALVDLLEQRGGKALLERVKRDAGVGTDVFLSLERYPDQTTVDLVVAASNALGVTAAELLQDFGNHWIVYASEHGYRQLMQARGDSLFAFIARLDELHSRLSLTFPELQPPSFAVLPLSHDTIRLRYTSTRDGLAPFVIGLLQGLAKLFGEPLTVTHEARKGDGLGHDEFLVQKLPEAR
jgi:Haem-NO-binding